MSRDPWEPTEEQVSKFTRLCHKKANHPVAREASRKYLKDARSVLLGDEAWLDVREAVTQRFLGISAVEFVARCNRGEYEDEDSHAFLMDVLAFFPELDA